MSRVITIPTHWDCGCTEGYIHKKTDSTYCPDCDCAAEDMPDSRENEVFAGHNLRINPKPTDHKQTRLEYMEELQARCENVEGKTYAELVNDNEAFGIHAFTIMPALLTIAERYMAYACDDEACKWLDSAVNHG